MLVQRARLYGLSLALLVVALAPQGAFPVSALAAPAKQDWPTYLHDVQRTSASTETILNPANASTLKQKWSVKTGGPIAASPTEVGGIVYVGSWDGNEYAFDGISGAQKWKTNLGLTNDPPCHPPTLGITSAAAVQGGVVYVGGGDAFWYALDAATGAVLWKVFTGDNSQTGAHYNWSSPLIVNGAAYIGIASNCDNPLVQGQLLKVDLTTHAVVATAKFVPDGQVGGGIWTSPSLDPATNTVFVTTGTLNLFTQTMSEAMVSLDAGSLAIKGVWQLPRNQAGSDTDWGTSPILFTDSANRQLVAGINKNGILYAFDRNNLGAGPTWQNQVAVGGDCPTCGDASVSSGAFANGVLYFAGGSTTISGTGYRGFVRAFNPANGQVIWSHGTDQPVVPAIAYDNGLVIDAEGGVLEVLDAASGNALFTFNTGPGIYAAPSIWNGRVYFGALDGTVYSLGLPTTTTNPPPDPNCPAGYSCQDIRNPSPGSEVVNGDGSWTITAAGAAIHGTSDQFRFLSKPVTGDAQLTAQMTQQSTQGTQPQAGIMMRQSNDPTSPFYAILEYPNNNTENQPLPKFLIWYRNAFGATSIEATKIFPALLPKYFMIQRQGNRFSASQSDDGVNYQLIPGTTQTIVMPASLMNGVAVDSGLTNTTGTATFNHVASGPISITPTPKPPATACPATWSCLDVGNPGPPGDQALANGVWTIKGTGADIGKASDQFHYVWQSIPGDATVTTQVTSQTNTSVFAKAGLVVRPSLDPGSPMYGVFVTPGKGILVQWRTTSNLITRPSATVPGAAPMFLRISRYTDTSVNPAVTYYTAFTSTDGANWSTVPGSTVALNMPGTIQAGMAVDSNAGGKSSTATFAGTTVAAGAIRPNTLCLPGWNCADIGVGFLAGGQAFNGNSWSMIAGGNDIWATYDQFHYIWQYVNTDTTVSARVVSTSGAGEWEKAGVMLRESTDPQAMYYGAFVTPSHGILVQYRQADGAATQQIAVPGAAPAYLRVARWTDTSSSTTYYTAYGSADGNTWTEIPNSTVVLSLPASVLAGVAADSYRAQTASIAFDSVSVAGSATPPPDACPTGWTCNDVGSGFPNGNQVLSGGNWTLNAGGGDIWGASDQFRLVSKALPGDGTAIAQVNSATNAGEWEKAGVMLRATTDPGAPYYGAFVTPSHGVAVQYRPAPGAATNQVLVAGTAPAYLMVSRYTASGNTYYTAYTSPDGSTWTAIPGSTVALNIPGTLRAGIAADAYNGGLAQVALDSVAVGGAAPVPPGICPDQWTCSDIGGATPAGSQNFAAGTWTIQGGGGDIWGTGDQFHYAWQSLGGDGSAVAHLTSQGNTSAFAKAGVMLRSGIDAGAPYYAVFLTPGSGLVIQHRDAQGAVTNQVQAAGAVPSFLKVTRTGTTFTAFTSPDGNTWTEVVGDSATIPALAGPALAGMAVTSHDTSRLSTAVFDSVTVGP